MGCMVSYDKDFNFLTPRMVDTSLRLKYSNKISVIMTYISLPLRVRETDTDKIYR